MKSGINIKRLGMIAGFVIISGAVDLYAQQVTLDIQPRTIRLNETANLKLNFINLNPPQSPALPDLPGFTVQYVGQEQQFQFVNGVQERRLTFNYRLVPSTSGQFQLGPFTLNFNGQNVDFDAIMMEVLPPSSSSPDRQTETIDDLVFAKVLLPRSEVYLQERFDVELALYYRGVQLDRGIQLQNMPGTGLNLDEFQEIGSSRESINNELYEVRRFRMRGTALTAGSFQLAPMVRVNVLVRRDRQQNDPFFRGFDDVFFGRYEAQPLSVPAEPITVTIRPLPDEGRPDNFGGAVGRFNMELDVQPREVTAGDPITLTIRITGQGNFEAISMPPINPGDDFRRYDPKLIVSGPDQKAFEQVFIPRSENVRELPPVSFTFFDPQEGKYQSIVRGPIPLTVKAGSAGALQMVQANSTAATTERVTLGIDIIDLKRTPAKWNKLPPPVNMAKRAVIHTAPLLAIAAVFMLQRRRSAIDQDVTRKRRSMAPRSARASIRRAENALDKQDPAAFHHALWQALADYVAHRCNLEAGEISPEMILSKVRAGGLSASHTQALSSVLQACDEARFDRSAVAFDSATLRQRLHQTQEILRSCEKISMKR
jgi:BatD DUF11 like domain